VRDPVEILGGAIIHGKGRHPFSFYSDNSFIDAGYIAGGNRSLAYLERFDATSALEEFPEIMAPGSFDEILQLASGVEEFGCGFLSPGDPAHLLTLRLPVGLVDGAKEATLDARLLVARQDGHLSSVRRIPGMRLVRGRAAEIHIIAAAEQMLQIHAAAAAGQHLFLSYSGRFRMLGGLPDLSTDGSFASAVVEPQAFFKAEPIQQFALKVPLPASLGALLVRRYPWCVPDEDTDWLALLALSSAAERSPII
jgi:hypothetical protein